MTHPSPRHHIPNFPHPPIPNPDEWTYLTELTTEEFHDALTSFNHSLKRDTGEYLDV